MTPTHKVATLFLLLGPELASEILKQMPRENASRILQALANPNIKVSDTEVDSVVKEFLPLLKGSKSHFAYDRDAAARILDMAKRSLKDEASWPVGQDDGIIDSIRDDLKFIRTDVLLPWLSQERPSTISVVLSLMEPEAGAAVFKRLPTSQHNDICLAIVELKKSDTLALEALSEELQTLRKQSSSASQTLGGKKVLSNLMQNLAPEFRNKLLDGLAEREPELAQELATELVTIARLSTLLPNDLAKLCAKLNDKELAMISKHEDATVSANILSGVSKSRQALIADEVSALQALRKTDLDTARSKMVALANQMKAEGKLIFPWEETLV